MVPFIQEMQKITNTFVNAAAEFVATVKAQKVPDPMDKDVLILPLNPANMKFNVVKSKSVFPSIHLFTSTNWFLLFYSLIFRCLVW